MDEVRINKEIFNGRPASSSGRLEKEIRVYELLDQLEIPFERIDHEATDSIDKCNQVEKILDIKICKNLFLCNSNKSEFYLLMMHGDKKFKTSVVSKLIGSTRLSFASEEYMEEYLDITPGSVSILGLMNDKENRVRLVIDEDVVKDEYIGCHPCINTSSLRIKTKDVLEKFLPHVKHEVTYINLQVE